MNIHPTHMNADTAKLILKRTHTYTHVHSPTDCHDLVAIRSKTEHPYRTLLVGQQTDVLERVAMETVYPATIGAKGNILSRGSNAGVLQEQAGRSTTIPFKCTNTPV